MQVRNTKTSLCRVLPVSYLKFIQDFILFRLLPGLMVCEKGFKGIGVLSVVFLIIKFLQLYHSRFFIHGLNLLAMTVGRLIA